MRDPEPGNAAQYVNGIGDRGCFFVSGSVCEIRDTDRSFRALTEIAVAEDKMLSVRTDRIHFAMR